MVTAEVDEKDLVWLEKAFKTGIWKDGPERSAVAETMEKFLVGVGAIKLTAGGRYVILSTKAGLQSVSPKDILAGRVGVLEHFGGSTRKQPPPVGGKTAAEN